MTRGLQARAWPWVVVVLLVALIACGPDDPLRHAYFEDFEMECDGAPCGWERSAGEPDQATWVETIHPGEHAIRLVGEASVRGPAAPMMSRIARGGTLRATVVARCDAGSSLSLDVLLNDPTVGVVVASGTVTPREDWTRIDAVLTPDMTFTSGTVSAVVIGKSGAGACEIGELIVDDFANDFVGGCV